ncbi:MAG: sensor histidine kinase [Acetatifactor sp.]|nr:sensor histidine kinase [Acetatifactor sp.]
MKLLRAYLHQHRKGILACALFCAVFAFTFYLYRLPVEAVFYPALVCTVLGVVFVAVDLVRVRQKHAKLAGIEKLTAAMISDMPDIDSVEDEDYQKIIAALRSEVEELETALWMRYQEMTDYYTVWVHQIKTPISSMKLVLQNEDTALARKLSADLFRIEQYVGMVLAFLRMDSESSDYVFRECDLDKIIRQSVKKFSIEFIERKIRLCYEPIREKIITDEKWFSFCMEQILSNALKYTREGSVKIYLQAPKILCIEDTGIGIAPEDLPRIFEKGYTGYNGRRDKQASGLGLYLCRRICDSLGIRISAESEMGRGTIIRMDLEQYDLKHIILE